MLLEMTVEKLEPALAIGVIRGPLTMGTNLKTVDHNLQALIESGVNRMVLDLSECPYSDSAGLGLLMHTFGLLEQRGGGLRLCGVSERVTALLKMTHTDKLLSCDADRETSVAAMGASAS